MQLGMIGLGRMGGNIVRRLMRNGHNCVVYDTNAASVTQLASEGATPSQDLASFVKQLQAPRAIWVMLPAGPITEATVNALSEVLESGDIIIDGATPTTKTTFAAPRPSRAKAFATSTWAPAAACGAWTAVTA